MHTKRSPARCGDGCLSDFTSAVAADALLSRPADSSVPAASCAKRLPFLLRFSGGSAGASPLDVTPRFLCFGTASKPRSIFHRRSSPGDAPMGGEGAAVRASQARPARRAASLSLSLSFCFPASSERSRRFCAKSMAPGAGGRTGGCACAERAGHLLGEASWR